MSPQEFVDRWLPSGGAERSAYAVFLVELCDLLGVPHPEPPVPNESHNKYVIDKTVRIANGDGTDTPGFIDLYRASAFVLETKQGVEKREAEGTPPTKRRKGHGVRGTAAMDAVLMRARSQAERYAKALPDEWPPFLVVVDIGASIDLYADFSGTGKSYAPFPAPGQNRIELAELRDENVRELLKSVWLDPLGLDPARKTAKVTRAIAQNLGLLAKKLEAQNHPPQAVAEFLLRCIFTMFAEDVRLLRPQSFRKFLEARRQRPDLLHHQLVELWRTMSVGGFSAALDDILLHFNGGLFENATALPLDSQALELLITAAQHEWEHVEPAIFGTLLENALDPDERHYLGAHYTPRRYVERLVLPTIMEPLREDWTATLAAAHQLDESGNRSAAIAEIKAFHLKLCHIRVLDPACGTGNFLYVAYDHLKRLEGEVIATLRVYDEHQANLAFEGATVTPRQFVGLEKNERAPSIAQLVLWIGHIQWHVRTHGHERPPEPVLENYECIHQCDAVLAWDGLEPAVDSQGYPRIEWDGTIMRHPVTSEEVPNPSCTRQVMRHVNARPAPPWPAADFIVGNPPYIGNWKMRGDLGAGYTEALRAAYPDVPESVDFVMYWWDRAALLVRSGQVRAFGLITTNSIRQVFARKVLVRHLAADPPLRLAMAIPDHPWTKDADGADVRVAMTVGTMVQAPGSLKEVIHEAPSGDVDGLHVDLRETMGLINPDLTVGVDITQARKLAANRGICSPGVKLHGDGFIVTPERATQLGLGTIPGLERVIVPYRNGRDINQRSRDVMVIDLFGLTEHEVRERFPAVYQHVRERVYPDRVVNNRATYRDSWWVFGEPRRLLRPALHGLARYIVTVETSKHRFFVFLNASVRPDNMLVAIASADAWHLGVLSSRFHVAWALRAGGKLGIGNDPRYNKTKCFDTFPFPDATLAQRERIRELGEALDAHRKARQELHPSLKLTDVYNVLEKERAGLPLDAADLKIHEQALVTTLRTLHEDLDRAVADAYGWPSDLDDEGIIRNLLDLNRARAREERDGLVRWLRPEYQNPGQTEQTTLIAVEAEPAEEAPTQRIPWPSTLPERAQAVRQALARLAEPVTVEQVARTFKSARRDQVESLLETLTTLGQARCIGDAYVM